MENGTFITTYYNRVGSKLRGISEEETSLIAAKEVGEAKMLLGQIPEIASYTVDRRIYNSLE